MQVPVNGFIELNINLGKFKQSDKITLKEDAQYLNQILTGIVIDRNKYHPFLQNYDNIIDKEEAEEEEKKKKEAESSN